MRTPRIIDYDSFLCDSCRDYIYDEQVGEPSAGVPSHTRIDSLPASWRCPQCGAGKDQLRACTLADDFVYEASPDEDANTASYPGRRNEYAVKTR